MINACFVVDRHRLLGFFCGGKHNPTSPKDPIISRNRYMIVEFKSNHLVQAKGWVAEVTFEDDPTETPHGEKPKPEKIQPGSTIQYPPSGFYEEDIDLKWLLQAPKGHIARFEVSYMDISCEGDSLIFYDGPNRQSEELQPAMCWRDEWGSVLEAPGLFYLKEASGPHMLMMLTTGLRTLGPHKGFIGQFTAIEIEQ
jgi:hypothetical protein